MDLYQLVDEIKNPQDLHGGLAMLDLLICLENSWGRMSHMPD
jgi:hypothetical protein